MPGKQAQLSVKTAATAAEGQDESKASPSSLGTLDTGIFNTTGETRAATDAGPLQPLIATLWALVSVLSKGGERPAEAKIPATDDEAYHKCFCRGSKLFLSFLLNPTSQNCNQAPVTPTATRGS